MKPIDKFEFTYILYSHKKTFSIRKIQNIIIIMVFTHQQIEEMKNEYSELCQKLLSEHENVVVNSVKLIEFFNRNSTSKARFHRGTYIFNTYK